MKNKKLNNGGFSLVELIIVIAIMAILAAALAPQLIKYIEKSRVSTDNQSCAAIKSAFNAAMNEEAVYAEVAANSGTVTITVANGTPSFSGAGTALSAELTSSLSDVKAPKETGKSSYTLTWTATNNQVSNVTVVTS